MVEEDKTEKDKRECVKTREIPLHFSFVLFRPLESHKGLLEVSFHAQTSLLFKIALKAPSLFAIIIKEVIHLLARMSDNWP